VPEPSGIAMGLGALAALSWLRLGNPRRPRRAGRRDC
jgi:hypothetical protein